LSLDIEGEGGAMYETGKAVLMTKGYRGVRGVIMERPESPFEFYLIRLENGIHLVAGPSAFEADPDS
jgi:hypothetical protein